MHRSYGVDEAVVVTVDVAVVVCEMVAVDEAVLVAGEVAELVFCELVAVDEAVLVAEEVAELVCELVCELVAVDEAVLVAEEVAELVCELVCELVAVDEAVVVGELTWINSAGGPREHTVGSGVYRNRVHQALALTNMLSTLTPAAGVHPVISSLKADADLNMCSMTVTDATSQLPMGWLKTDAW
jgi:hypothetical protein